MAIEPLAVTHGDRKLYESSEKQTLFHRAQEPNILFGGAARGGKSRSLRWHGIMACLEYPDFRACLIRRQFTDLQTTHLLEIPKEVPPEVAQYNGSTHRLNFDKGSLLQFMHFNTDADFSNFLSTEWDAILVDEAGECSAYQLSMLPSRLIRPSPYRKQFRLTSNPGGPGHQYLADRFLYRNAVNGKLPDGTRYDSAEWRFIPCKATDNPYLDPAELQRLKDLPEPMRSMYWEGKWDLPLGNLFAELDRNVHRVPLVMWPGARRTVTADWGWSAQAPAVWWQSDHGTAAPARHMAYREWVPDHTPPHVWAEQVCLKSGAQYEMDDPRNEMIDQVVLDAAAFDPLQDGSPGPAEQMIATFRHYRLRLVPSVKGPGSIEGGVNLLHTYLWTYDGQVAPLLTIAESCPMLWDAMVTVQRAKVTEARGLTDIPAPGQMQLHLLDTARYFVQGRPKPAELTLAQRIEADKALKALDTDPLSYQHALQQRAKKAGVPLVRIADAFKKPQQRYPWGGKR
jgi:hypothetical protein